MTTLQHSTDEALVLPWFQPGSPASLIALLENVRRLVTSVTSGQRWCEYWGKRERNGFWEKTSQDCLALNLDIFLGASSMTWPYWGTAWDGEAGKLVTLVRVTKDGEYLSLPTPKAQNARAAGIHGNGGIGLQEFFLLPTPNTMDYLPARSCSAMVATINPNAEFPNLETMIARQTGERGTLNPLFVERMMGFPENWTQVD